MLIPVESFDEAQHHPMILSQDNPIIRVVRHRLLGLNVHRFPTVLPCLHHRQWHLQPHIHVLPLLLLLLLLLLLPLRLGPPHPHLLLRLNQYLSTTATMAKHCLNW
jgi:hypothetical protein